MNNDKKVTILSDKGIMLQITLIQLPKLIVNGFEQLITYFNHNSLLFFKIKWTDRDLNPGPPPCQGDDLPSELPAQY